MRKFGRFIVSLVPMIVFLVIQVVVSIAAIVALMVTDIASGNDSITNIDTFMTGIFEHSAMIMLITQFITLLVFGLWYYFYMKRPKLENPSQVFSVKAALAIIGICFGLSTLIDLLFQIVHYANPIMLEEYNELMEMAGITDFSIYSILTVVVLAPICEEIVFRGLTLKLAQKFTSKFWLANFIQAFTFGFVHLNILQGLYAFALGLVLGHLYQKYQSLYVPIFMHMVFNFIGSIVTEMVYTKINSDIGYWILVIVTIAVGIWGFRGLTKDKGRTIEQNTNSVFH